MTLLLMPMQFGLFHGVTWTSLPANLWAVPIVSLLSVPMILFAIIAGAGAPRRVGSGAGPICR